MSERHFKDQSNSGRLRKNQAPYVPPMNNGRVIAKRPRHSRLRFPFGLNPVGTEPDFHEDRLFACVKRCVGNSSPENRGDRGFPEHRIVVLQKLCSEIVGDQTARSWPLTFVEEAQQDSSLSWRLCERVDDGQPNRTACPKRDLRYTGYERRPRCKRPPTYCPNETSCSENSGQAISEDRLSWQDASEHRVQPFDVPQRFLAADPPLAFPPSETTQELRRDLPQQNGFGVFLRRACRTVRSLSRVSPARPGRQNRPGCSCQRRSCSSSREYRRPPAWTGCSSQKAFHDFHPSRKRGCQPSNGSTATRTRLWSGKSSCWSSLNSTCNHRPQDFCFHG